uniref:Uncharacterized protein n=1 Tax=Oryza meridionalis TaxID=40149 RepID=A0A0E0EJB6_9ORYZ
MGAWTGGGAAVKLFYYVACKSGAGATTSFPEGLRRTSLRAIRRNGCASLSTPPIAAPLPRPSLNPHSSTPLANHLEHLPESRELCKPFCGNNVAQIDT